jgi:hypothetical protein
MLVTIKALQVIQRLKKIEMKTMFCLLFFSTLLFSCSPGYAQFAESGKDIIFSAMQDELDRTLNKLEHPEAGKPFFVSFYYSKGSYLNSSATLGAVTSSRSGSIASSTYRLMMGDYDMNDENFEEVADYEQVFPRNISPPLDMDYMGIRRAFWNLANESYKAASKNYLAKQAFFKKNPLQKPAFPDYLKQAPVTINMPEPGRLPGTFQADSLVRALSFIFRKYEQINTSMVNFSMVNCNLYILNSEGSRIRMPVSVSTVVVTASVLNSSGESFSESISFVSLNPTGLLHDTTLPGRIDNFAHYLLKVANAPRLEEIYNGPVLYTGTTSAPKLMRMLFSGKEALVAKREDIRNTPEYRRSEPKNNNNIETKMGKKVLPVEFSVVLKPTLGNYKGIDLFGKTLVDFDATVPPDELILVENGILRDLLRNRVPSAKNVTSSNGHYRMGISESSILWSLEPSNIFFTSATAKPQDELKHSLLSLARQEGLEYAILVRPVDEASNKITEAFYRVSLEDGSETLIQPLRITSEGGKMINHIAGCSDRELVFNFLSDSYNNYYYNYDGFDISYSSGSSGIPCSIIMPDAMLFKGMEAESRNASVDKWLLPEEGEE